jgi:hypothetical protein
MRRSWAFIALAAVAAIVGPTAAAASSPQCKHWQGDPTTPCLVVTPDSGPVGTHVRFHGTIPADQISRYDDEWHNHPFYGLTGEFPASKKFPQGCELILPAQGLKIALDNSSGVVRGSFTVGRRGTCSQNAGTANARTTYPAIPGTFSLFVGSLSTYIATFHVTSGATGGQTATPATTAAPSKNATARKTPHKHVRPHQQSTPSPTDLPYTGPPILQLVLLGGAVLCAGVAIVGTPRAAPAGRHRAA